MVGRYRASSVSLQLWMFPAKSAMRLDGSVARVAAAGGVGLGVRGGRCKWVGGSKFVQGCHITAELRPLAKLGIRGGTCTNSQKFWLHMHESSHRLVHHHHSSLL